MDSHLNRCWLAAAAAIVVLGPLASARVDTGGLQRNVFIALLESAVPRVAPQHFENEDWRTSPLPTAGSRSLRQDAELSRFKGAAAGRNVVLIFLESTGAQYLKPYGAVEDPMPNFTRLANQAILFENAYAVYPESIKGLFSVLCSRYPALDTSAGVCARVATGAVASRLAAAGYRTGLFHSGRFMYLGMDEVVQQGGFETLEDAGAIGGHHQSSFGVDEPATVQRMLTWIDSLESGERFFLTYLPVAGHHPYECPGPGPFAGNNDRGRYLNALHYSDTALGALVEGLKARGLFEKTLLVLLGDHGEAFGQHQGNYGHTLFIYDENIRVPCLIVLPGLIGEPIRVARLASLIDTAPTILHLMGLSIPDDYQGRSLLEARRQMALFYTDYSLGLLGLRDGCWKYIYEVESGRSQLFDLGDDPGETQNRAAEFPGRARAYGARLQQWAAAQRHLIRHPQELAANSTRGLSRRDNRR